MPPDTILIADDEACITFMLGTRLEESGFKVLTAADGDDALALALANRPTVIVTDFQMPRMSGLELAQRLRDSETTRSIPLVLLTARGHRLTPTELRDTNVQHLMSKPFSFRELLGIIQDMCRDNRAQRKAAA